MMNYLFIILPQIKRRCKKQPQLFQLWLLERVKKRLVGADAYIGPFVNVTNSPETDNNRCFHCGAM